MSVTTQITGRYQISQNTQGGPVVTTLITGRYTIQPTPLTTTTVTGRYGLGPPLTTSVIGRYVVRYPAPTRRVRTFRGHRPPFVRVR